MTATNGTTSRRKTLSTQLDRLDDILDCLGDGLNEAVRDAVKEAVGDAVRVSVRETLHTLIEELASNPQSLTLLRNLVAPQSEPNQADAVPETTPQNNDPAEPLPSKGWGARMWGWMGAMVCTKWETAKTLAKGAKRSAKVLWQHRWSALSLTGIAVGVGSLSFALGPVSSAVLAGLGGVSTAILAVAALAVWRLCQPEACFAPIT